MDAGPGFEPFLIKFETDGGPRREDLGTGSGYGRVEYACHGDGFAV